MTEYVWIDLTTSTYGSADDSLMFVDVDTFAASGVNDETDDHRCAFGLAHGVSLDDLREDAYQDGQLDVQVTLDDWTALVEAVQVLLKPDGNGACLYCGQTFKFHSSSCPVHEVNVAMDRVDGTVRL